MVRNVCGFHVKLLKASWMRGTLLEKTCYIWCNYKVFYLRKQDTPVISNLNKSEMRYYSRVRNAHWLRIP